MSLARFKWWIIAFVLGLGASVSAALGSCSTQQAASGSHGIKTPLGPAGSQPEATASTDPVAPEPLELDRFSPILLEMRFGTVLAPLQEGKDGDAAAALGAIFEADTELAARPEMQFLLGRLKERAGKSEAALAAYHKSAAEQWVLQDYARYYAGRLALGSGDAKAALSQLRAVDPSVPVPRSLHLGESAQLTGDPTLAVAELRKFLGTSEYPDGWVRASMLLAKLLVEGRQGYQPELDDRLEALRLVRRVTLEAAGTEAAQRATELSHRILGELPSDQFEAQRKLSAEDQLVRLNALAAANKYGDVLVASDELLQALPKKERFGVTACEARLLHNKGLAKAGKWGKAVDAFDDVIAHCVGEDLRARALFLSGRYAMADKRFSKATRLYAQLEKEAPTHRLADDARLHRAEAYLELGDSAKFTALLSSIAEDYPDGDVALDGTFALALGRIEKRDWAGAANVLERGIAVATNADTRRDHETAGRERYFLARAWIETGEVERGLSEYAALIRDCPLSYYMQHAYSRLAQAQPERAEKELRDALARSEQQPFSFQWRSEFETPQFRRVFELLRVGEVDAAARELDSLGAVGEGAAPELLWAVALLYDRAGAPNMAQQVLRGRLTDWLRRWPVGDWRKAWELAFPRPYHPIVTKEAKRNELPEALIYAVIREESVFDAGAVSHADAYGLMQLIEPTAKHFAKKIGMHYSRSSLLRPHVNIRLGAKVLSTYSSKFPENPLLGIPGYNAGPGRPKRWRKERPNLDFDTWVELIPFRETRRYTKRVLASRGAYAVIYDGPSSDWRLPTALSETAD